MTTTPGPECREPLVHPYAEHDGRVAKHYAHALEKHPYFCDSLYPKTYTQDMAKCRCKDELEACRALILKQARDGRLQWDLLLNCEIWEAHEAIANGDNAAAVEELYDAIAVLLRTIDVVEGRQTLGDPNAVKTGDMLLAENERMRKALADTAENLRVHLQIPTQTISMNRLEVEAMAKDCEKALGEEGGEA